LVDSKAFKTLGFYHSWAFGKSGLEFDVLARTRQRRVFSARNGTVGVETER
jgi:hypothetical protein